MSQQTEELTVQKFDRRCPYCDQVVSYDRSELKAGENPVQCPSCHKVFIRIIDETMDDGEKRG